MSFVQATPEFVAAAATDLARIGSTISSANTAALGPTSGVLAPGADEVSASIAALFDAHSQVYQALSAQAAAFHSQFVQLMNGGALQYAVTEAANTTPLQSAAGPASVAAQLPAVSGAVGGSAPTAPAAPWRRRWRRRRPRPPRPGRHAGRGGPAGSATLASATARPARPGGDARVRAGRFPSPCSRRLRRRRRRPARPRRPRSPRRRRRPRPARRCLSRRAPRRTPPRRRNPRPPRCAGCPSCRRSPGKRFARIAAAATP
ncbi:PE family protein [Mycobacterium avium MAV_120809_2495]|uniref:PE family protein n=1 Tax=Mycobacterium avium TaxID=1764 RepID=UPI00044CB10A|nr:PE family protein [Mycobacterium avium]ETZ47942.1 PE family protein [Mycobacterium avium MAV_120809_2495]